jgi:hypothetical protein
MKNLFIVLLIAAIGAGAYLYFSKRQNDHVNSKELIVGKWKIDSIKSRPDDSISDFDRIEIAQNDIYSFDSAGLILKQSNNPKKTDTGFYKWTKKDELIWSRIKNDSIIKPFRVLRLDLTTLILQSNDNGSVVCRKLK